MSHILAIDIGGTKIDGVLFQNGMVIKEMTIPTPHSLAEFKHSLQKLSELLVVGITVKGVGIGCAGVVSTTSTTVIYSPNMKFIEKFNFKKFFKQYLNIENVFLDNDVNCFTRAQLHVGIGKKFKNFIGITLGTGIGSGMVINGELYRGSHHSGGEIGHIVMSGNLTFEDVFKKAKDKTNQAELGEILGKGFAAVINMLDPDALILGGTVALQRKKILLPIIQAELQKHLLNKNLKPKIFFSTLKHSSALGASLLVK